MGVQFPEKKHYVTLEWPPSESSIHKSTSSGRIVEQQIVSMLLVLVDIISMTMWYDETGFFPVSPLDIWSSL